MTFREAVLAGCKTTRQKFSASFDKDSACVLQAALVGASIISDPGLAGTAHFQLLRERFPVLKIKAESCPVCDSPLIFAGKINSRPIESLGDQLIHLNDTHKWPRERIASRPIESLGDQLIHLNDTHKWPRERIAALVDTYEQPADFEQSDRESALLSLAYPNRMRLVEVSDIEHASEHCEDATADLAGAILNHCTVGGLDA